jgi:hypothetical protein
MSDVRITIETFGDEPSAILAQAILAANGIAAVVSADTAGRMEPQLQYARGVRLIVRLEDASRAEDLLDAHEQE